jgi:hypothetical protein
MIHSEKRQRASLSHSNPAGKALRFGFMIFQSFCQNEGTTADPGRANGAKTDVPEMPGGLLLSDFGMDQWNHITPADGGQLSGFHFPHRTERGGR